MNPWAWATALLGIALVPAALVALRGGAFRRLIGLEMTGVIVSLLFLTWAEIEHRSSLMDVGLAAAFMAFGAGLVFARFLERAS